MQQICPTLEQWSEILRRLPHSALDASPIDHLDRCQKCWSVVTELNVGLATQLDQASGLRMSRSGRSGNSSGPAAVAGTPAADCIPFGTRLGPFRLLSQLGRGGMGIVYQAIDDRCGRQVAVKCLNPDRRSAAFTAGLAREARLLSQLHHPNVVQMLEFNLDHEPPYLVLELATGGSLRKALKHNNLNAEQSVMLTVAVARAVHAAHESGVLHLDLKPENILLTENAAVVDSPSSAGVQLPWTPKVADFGLCISVHGQAQFAEVFRRPQGTLAWMAPEQFSRQSNQLGRATDVYALGLILYELLTGTTPFRSSHDLELCAQICRCPPCPPRELHPEISKRLNRICLRCLQKDPADRFETAAELADALDSLAAGPSPLQWLRRLTRITRQPKQVAKALQQPLQVLAGLVLGAALVRGYPVFTRSSSTAVHAPPTDTPPVTLTALATPGDEDPAHLKQLLTEILEGDRMLEYVRLMPVPNDQVDGNVRFTQFLSAAVIRSSRQLLSNPAFVQILLDSAPQTLLLARLHELAGLAATAEFDVAIASWKTTEMLAFKLHRRKLLDEHLRSRAFIAMQLLDESLARHNRGSEGLQLLRAAWLIFGPATHGQPLHNSAFKTIFDEFHWHLHERSVQEAQDVPPAGTGEVPAEPTPATAPP
jgi:serine/threonine protein kinase